MSTNGHVQEEIDHIMDKWHDMIRDVKAELHGPITRDSRTNAERELDILVTFIIPHTFRFMAGSSPNDLNNPEEEAMNSMVWNYPAFARVVSQRASGFKGTPAHLFAEAFDVLKRGDPAGRARFLEVLFGEKFVRERIGDRKIIYEFSKRRSKTDSSDDPEELKAIPAFTSTRA